MRRVALTALTTLTFSTAPALALDGQITLDFGGDCSTDLPPRCSTQMNVFASLEGASAGGITGAEYRIEVGPAHLLENFIFTENVVSGALALGAGALTPSANGVRGLNIAFPTCQTGDASARVLLETISIFRLDFGLLEELQFRVVKHDQASNQFFQCPLFTICDAPVYTKVCLGIPVQCQNPEPPHANDALCSTSGEAWINGRDCCLSCEPTPPNCTIAVESRAWSQVKSLYRN